MFSYCFQRMTEGGGMFVQVSSDWLIQSKTCSDWLIFQVSPETIVAAGDSIGVANIPGNVTRALAEDVSYR